MGQQATWGDILSEIQDTMDLSDEVFATPAQLMKFANSGIKYLEGKIHTLYEDYFRNITSKSIVSGTAEIDLPTDIYGVKLRNLQYYASEDDTYKVKKIGLPEEAYLIKSTSTRYRYDLRNDSTNGMQIILLPTPAASVTNGLKIEYLRRAARYTGTSDRSDIPESDNFIAEYVKKRVYEKEKNWEMVGQARADLKMYEQAILDALSNMLDDGSNEMKPDLTLFAEMT